MLIIFLSKIPRILVLFKITSDIVVKLRLYPESYEYKIENGFVTS